MPSKAKEIQEGKVYHWKYHYEGTFKYYQGVLEVTLKSYERMRTNHELTDSYFYLARHIAKCMMISDALNSRIYPVRTEMTGMQHILTLRVCSKDESESEEFLVDRTLSQVYSTDED